MPGLSQDWDCQVRSGCAMAPWAATAPAQKLVDATPPPNPAALLGLPGAKVREHLGGRCRRPLGRAPVLRVHLIGCPTELVAITQLAVADVVPAGLCASTHHAPPCSWSSGICPAPSTNVGMPTHPDSRCLISPIYPCYTGICRIFTLFVLVAGTSTRCQRGESPGPEIEDPVASIGSRRLTATTRVAMVCREVWSASDDASPEGTQR